MICFFFQAEDGIRDYDVTGVQTCALPISIFPRGGAASEAAQGVAGEQLQYKKRHFTLFTPRDFDLSPYFAVVKPTIEKGFDYRRLNWQQSERQKGATSDP